MTPAFRYKADLIRVVDADTLILRVDLGLRCSVTVTVRVRNIDAPELNTPEGKDAAALVTGWLRTATITIETYKDAMSFNRWVADVWLGDDLLADRLRAAFIPKEIA